MKILVICQYYHPEPFRISDICEEFVKRGHEVTVITGVPNYPMGETYEEYTKGQKREEVRNGVKIHRCYTIPRKSGSIRRFLNYYSYALSSYLYVSKLGDDFDVVFVNQLSPVMMAKAGIKYKKKHHKKMVLYCLDLWPESLVAGGITRHSFIYKFFHRISKGIYKEADTLLVTSQMFGTYFEKEFALRDIQYLPQYAELFFAVEICKKEPDENIDLMFAGNIGTAQSVETIVQAAAECSDITNLFWHIVGDGSDLQNCKQLASELKVENVIFHGRRPMEEMPVYYAMADAMLVTMQADEVLSLTLPGKVQSYMAAGKPILGAIHGETQRIISVSQCGLAGDAESSEQLSQNVRKFMTLSAAERLQFGVKARDYYEDHFTREFFMDEMEKCLKKEVRSLDV